MENKSAAILAQEEKNDYQCKCRDFSVAPVIMKINDDGSLCRQLVHKKLNILPTFPSSLCGGLEHLIETSAR